MTAKNKLHGIFTALVTPFKSGELDLKSFKKLLRHQLDQGVMGFVINGTTAESPCLNYAEVHTLFDLAKSECAGQATLIVGTGGNSTAQTSALSREVSAWSPDALLVVVPYYNKPPQRGLQQHFGAVARASSVPLLLYNVPSRTVADLEPATVAELGQEKNIVGIKDATGNMDVFHSLQKHVPSDFVLLSGDDASCVEFCARGGHGVISVSSHVIAREMAAHLSAGTHPEYRQRFAPLMKWLYIESNPIPVKMALHWMGILESPELRLPLVELDGKYKKEFQACLKSLGKI